VIVVSNDVVTGRSGSYNAGSVTIPWLDTRGIVTRSATTFYDQRECRDMAVTEIDVAKLVANYSNFTQLLGRPLKTLWVLDLGDDGKTAGKDKDLRKQEEELRKQQEELSKQQEKLLKEQEELLKKEDKAKEEELRKQQEELRKQEEKLQKQLDELLKKQEEELRKQEEELRKQQEKADKDSGKGAAPVIGGVVGSTAIPPGVIRLRNASTLPSTGLSVISPNPIYVLNDFNVVNPVPALIAGDSVTILSGNWNDLNGSKLLTSRVAANTTVNAAIITGIVPTGNGGYSGGAENCLRLLEDWTGKTLTFNGSIAVLYYSKIADATWGGPEVYSPPTRNWSYDTKLSDLVNTPPAMPAARTVFRSDWTLIKPNSKL
jgi:hypothetical protein